MKQKKKYYPAEHLQLVRSGEDYFEHLTTLLQKARHFIHLQTYIFANDTIGKKIADELIAAAERGVKVNVLLDSYGSAGFKKRGAGKLLSAGVNLRFFSPVYLNSGLRIGRRLHHKIVVIDDKEALVGGINISDDYFGSEKIRPWLDFAVYVRGDVCKRLSRICNELLKNKITRPVKMKESPALKDSHIHFSQSDYIRGRRQITLSYRRAITAAREEITIMNAYFMPGIRLKKLLRKAAKRGVKIRLILSGKSDVLFMKAAMNHYYHWLFRNNIEVYEYQPAIVHAKAAVFDKRLALIGSFNLNFLSEYISIELNADINDSKFCLAFNDILDEMIRKDCVRVHYSFIQRINLWNIMVDTIAYYAISFSQSVLFFFTRKDKVNEIG